MIKARESLIQVELKHGQVLLGIKDTSAFARGNRFDVIAFSPEDAIALANQLAEGADIIMTSAERARRAGIGTDTGAETTKEIVNGNGTQDDKNNNQVDGLPTPKS